MERTKKSFYSSPKNKNSLINKELENAFFADEKFPKDKSF